jgi:carbamoyl-phosphate synthase large subunit
LLIGSGPIVIGQACEFDYSGTQACRVLRSEGYRVVLVNSNPATIMTDPEFADATYIEPLDLPTLAQVIAKERPQALLPTLGGQTALNLAVALHDAGVVQEHGVELIGADIDAIRTAEDRQLFKMAMQEIGLNVPPSGIAHTVDEAMLVAERVGYPLIVRPAFILGGGGTGIATNADEMLGIAERGIAASPISEILVERSIYGWKEYELEVMRDHADNCVVICSIENVDPMGVHTGESITVAPAQTLTDVEYQHMRDAAFACIRRIGVDTGGSNVQFAVNPRDGEMMVIEMNPRVSRSSALASKATGFPIAKIAAKLAVGYTLDEIRNDITRVTPASFEPTIDYVVTKFPRWAFEKLPGAAPVLGTQMQSVGEAMAIGRTFTESLQKAIRSLETGRAGLNCDPAETVYADVEPDELLRRAAVPTPDRIFEVEAALRSFIDIDRVHEMTGIDPWFCDQILQIVEQREELAGIGFAGMSKARWRAAKRMGFSDIQLAYLWDVTEQTVRDARLAAGVAITYKTVDTCASEFAAETPYHYGTYEDTDEVAPLTRPAVVILGSGPNRIGQGVEFDYCCVHAAFALSDAGYETVMLNCNPETVSTDYDTSDRLFFEPLTGEDVLNVCERLQERGELTGVVVALGGQTPLKLAQRLETAGYTVLGTSPDSIDLAEDRERFNAVCEKLGIPQPPGGTANEPDAAVAIARKIGYPVLVRPSYVLGGRAMEIVYDDSELRRAMGELARTGSLGREGGLSAERPALVDRFLEDAIEVDVDALRDYQGEVLIGGVMEHIEEAGVHSGDSACAIPAPTLSAEVIQALEHHTRQLADALEVRGPINVQFAVKDESVYVLEANPRASRTIPFVSKATGVPLAKIAARLMLGATLAQLRDEGLVHPPAGGGHIAVKEAVLPFARFPGVDTVLGPEMRSTGEVMGIDRSFGLAFAKSQAGAGNQLPKRGAVFFSLAARDKPAGLRAAQRFAELGFSIAATSGTAEYLREHGIGVETVVAKVGEELSVPRATKERSGGVRAERASGSPSGREPQASGGGEAVDAVELLASGQVQLVVNTPRGRGPRADGMHIRRSAIANGVACVTTVAAAIAAAQGIAELAERAPAVRSLQEYHRDGQLKLDV